MTVCIGKIAKTVGKMMEDLAEVIADAKAIKPFSIHLFHNRRGQSHFKEDRTPKTLPIKYLKHLNTSFNKGINQEFIGRVIVKKGSNYAKS